MFFAVIYSIRNASVRDNTEYVNFIRFTETRQYNVFLLGYGAMQFPYENSCVSLCIRVAINSEVLTAISCMGNSTDS
jgi:hypothetical protein